MKSKPHAAPSDAASEDLPPRLHCEGGQLIKPNGYPITLRGVSFGAVGEDEPADVPAVQAMGANCVRVALRWWTPYGGGIESRDNDGFAFLLRENVARWVDLVSAVAAAGLWSIPFVDSNCGQLGTQDADTMAYCDPRGSWGARGRNFLTDPAMRATFAAAWSGWRRWPPGCAPWPRWRCSSCSPRWCRAGGPRRRRPCATSTAR